MSRREDAFARVNSGAYRRPPQAQAVRDALIRLASNPDYEVLLGYLRHREWTESAAVDAAADAGALLRMAGRRSLLRELERLDQRLVDDDRTDQRE